MATCVMTFVEVWACSHLVSRTACHYLPCKRVRPSDQIWALYRNDPAAGWQCPGNDRRRRCPQGHRRSLIHHFLHKQQESSLFFWDIALRQLIIGVRRFRENQSPHLQTKRCPNWIKNKDFLDLYFVCLSSRISPQHTLFRKLESIFFS